MRGQSYGFGLAGQRLCNRLPDPQRTVAGQFRALVGVKPIDGPHQANVAFADEVQQRQTDPFVGPGDLDNQRQVGLDHLLTSFPIPFLDATREFDFFLGGEQLHSTNVSQVQRNARIALERITHAA